MTRGYAPIEEYGVIGDLHTVALVGMDGSIDFLCLPVVRLTVGVCRAPRRRARRTLPARAAARRRGPQAALPARHQRAAHPVPRQPALPRCRTSCRWRTRGAHNLVRRAKTRARRGAFRHALRSALRLCPRHAHGRAAERHRSPVRRSRWARELALRLRASVPMRVADGAAAAEFTLRADESAWFVLEVVTPDEPSPCAQPDYERDAFKETVNFWRRWIGRSTYQGRWREMVNRSALVLKLLTSRRARLDRGGADVRLARARSVASATGTTATRGSATRPSRSTASCASATPARRGASCAG